MDFPFLSSWTSNIYNTSAYFAIGAASLNVTGTSKFNGAASFDSVPTFSAGLGATTINGTLGVTGVTTLTGAASGLIVSVGTASFSVTPTATGTITLGRGTGTGTITLGQSTGTQTIAIATGATTSGNIKTINMGTSGAAGSTTNVIIGSTLSNTFVTINANTTTFTGSLSGITTVNSASYTVGSAFVANSTVVTTSGLFTGNTGNNFAIGYRDVPQNFTNTTYTFALGDAGKHILTQNSGSSTQTLTLPNSSSVAFQTGTTIDVVVQSAGTVLLANGVGVTMYLAGNSTAKSSITLNTYSQSTALKIGTDTWFITSTSAA